MHNVKLWPLALIIVWSASLCDRRMQPCMLMLRPWVVMSMLVVRTLPDMVVSVVAESGYTALCFWIRVKGFIYDL